MKIYILDEPSHKISHWHSAHWEAQGHECDYDMYFDIEKVKWADACVFFWCEPPAQELSKLSREEYPCKRIVQIVDIDAYAGHWGGVNWNNIDHMVFMSKHIQGMVNDNLSSDYKDVLQHQIPLGIDLDKWKYRVRAPFVGANVGFLAAEWWSSKAPNMVIQFMAKLVKDYPGRPWHFYWSGVFNMHEMWLYKYVQNQIDALDLRDKVTINFAREDSIDEWMENIDYLVTFGQKDSYSLIVGEAMAKGIKTMAHNFWGADKVWKSKYVWRTLDEVVCEIGEGSYDSAEYRKYIEDNHNIKEVLKQWDAIVTTKT